MEQKEGARVKIYFERQIHRAAQISSDGDLRLHIVSTVRHAMQQAILGLLEWAVQQPTQEGAFLPAEVSANVLRASDGTMIDFLEAVVIYCEQLGWSGVSRSLFTPVGDGAACEAICDQAAPSVVSLLRGLVKLRNDGAEGHGLPGDYNRDAELDCLQKIISEIGSILPVATGDGGLVLGPPEREAKIRFLRMKEGNPILIRSVRTISRAKLRVDAQYFDSNGKRQTVRFEALNFLSSLNAASAPAYTTWSNSWDALCFVPERTTESFQGRGDEQKLLASWMDDEDSRTCLVYGDGGVGKTTLVIEFLHRFLEEDPDLLIRWKPKVVSFYTAKKWSWGIDGVQLITAGQPHLMGLIAHLHLLLLGRVASQEFYRLDAPQAAVKLQRLMADEAGINRDDHLIVVDNSETLVTSDKDIEQLGRELREISRRLGRVIITSRRREILEATPVAVDKLNHLDAVALVKQRGRLLQLKAIRRSTDAQLLLLVTELGGKPLVLEAFVQALTDPASSTVALAKQRVSAMLRRDLGEFLFADAWARYSTKIKRLLLLMTRVADVHDGRQLAICCELAGVTLQEAEEGLEESSGIASVARLNSGLEISFSTNFIDFAKDKCVTIGGIAYPLDSEVVTARQKYSTFVQAVRSFSGDRIAPAFRTPLAKAAHRARKEGRNEEALRLYQQAVLSDPNNGWLLDRFAYFLFHDLRDNPAALVQAKRATDLMPSEGEIWFTRGIIESRLGQHRQCEISLERAESLGIDRIRCAVQRAWAYLKTSPALLNLARVQVNFLKHALASQPRSHRSWVETEMLMSRITYLEQHGRNVRG